MFFVGVKITPIKFWVESFEKLVVVDESVLFELVVSEDHWFPGGVLSSLSFLLGILVKKNYCTLQNESCCWQEEDCKKSNHRTKKKGFLSLS